ncbi:MAG: hypothetical protein GX794_01525, partial [Acholeplasmataceae bacterium]|nr:hypothetical protein [Acholeplasmataceae bacterium]
KNLYVSGNIKANNYVGGIVGYQESGTIKDVYNLAKINAASYVGGIVGSSISGVIERVYNFNDITGTGDRVGGIVGQLQSTTLTDSYNRSEIIGTNYVGGLVGYTWRNGNQYSSYTTYRNSITNSYSSGLVSSNSNVGGIIGYDYSANHSTSPNARTNLYYDVSVLSLYDQPKNQKPSVAVSTQGRKSDFLLYSTHASLGFNEDIWVLKPKTGDYAFYPQLKVFIENDLLRVSGKSNDSVKVNVKDGLGTKEIPFLIRTKFDMDELSRKVSEGNSYNDYYFKVDDGIAEIKLGNFIPIGTSSNPFQGSFDGNGVNFDIAIERPNANRIGLYGYVTVGVIENFSLTGSVKGRNHVGSAAGFAHSNITIKNIYNQAKIEGASEVGGLVGRVQQATLTNLYNRGEIIGTNYVGGLVGYTWKNGNQYSSYTTYRNSITNSYSSGLVSANSNVGGIIGYDHSANHSTSANARTNLYYDVIVIAEYDQPMASKPSSLESATYALNTSKFFKEMASRLNSDFVFLEITDTYGYYPQLRVFAEHDLAAVKEESVESVKVNIEGGLGTEDIPFYIETVAEMIELQEKVANGNTYEGFYFEVRDTVGQLDLDNFTPIGSNTKPFYGSFNGNFTEFILDIDTTQNYQGLFGYFGKGTIKNLYVSGNIKANNYVGGIVGYQESGTIKDVYNLAKINAASYV